MKEKNGSKGCKLVSYRGKRGLFLAFVGMFAFALSGSFTLIPWFGGVFGMACEGSCDELISNGRVYKVKGHEFYEKAG